MDRNFASSPALPNFARDFINHLAVINKTMNTQLAYMRELRMFLQYLCDNISGTPSSPSGLSLTSIESLTHREIEAYLSWARLERQNGERALARKQAVIKSFFRYLLREDLISKDVTIKLKPIQVNQKAPKALEPNQVADLVDLIETGDGLTDKQQKYHSYTEKRDYAILLTLIGTGIRLSELCSLDLRHIDISKQCFEIKRKGNKETNIYFNHEVLDAIKNYIDHERPRYARIYDSPALFLSMQGKRISKRAVQNLIKKYMSVLSSLGHNTSDFSTHKMRSTFATLLLRETNNLAIVQDALGHTDPRTTRIYAKVLDEQLMRAANFIKFR